MTRLLTSKYISVGLTYISWFSDFALYLEYYLLDKCHTWDISSMWPSEWPLTISRSLWPIFHASVILPFIFDYYFMENCHTWIIISMWQNDLHTNTSRSVWPILYGLTIKMLQYKMYPAGELAVLRQLLFKEADATDDWCSVLSVDVRRNVNWRYLSCSGFLVCKTNVLTVQIPDLLYKQCIHVVYHRSDKRHKIKFVSTGENRGKPRSCTCLQKSDFRSFMR